MKWLNSLYTVLGALLLALSFLLLGGSSVNAASAWDDVLIQSSDELLLGYCDISTKIFNFLEDEEHWWPSENSSEIESRINSYKDAINNDGGWLVYNLRLPNGQNSVHIGWSSQPNNPGFEWKINQTFGYPYSRIDFENIISMVPTGSQVDCDSDYRVSTAYGSNSLTFREGENEGRYIFVSTYAPNYPPGYDGELIPTEVQGGPPADDIDDFIIDDIEDCSLLDYTCIKNATDKGGLWNMVKSRIEYAYKTPLSWIGAISQFIGEINSNFDMNSIDGTFAKCKDYGFVGAEKVWHPSYCISEFNNLFFGSNMYLYWGMLEREAPTLWRIGITIIRLTILIGLIYAWRGFINYIWTGERISE